MEEESHYSADNKRNYGNSQAPPSMKPTDGSSAGQQTVLTMDEIQLAKQNDQEIAKNPRVEEGSGVGEKTMYLQLQPCSKIQVTEGMDADPNSPNSAVEQISKAEQVPAEKEESGSSLDCAACLYQNKTCPFNCPLAPFFPKDRNTEFMNCLEVYGLEKLKDVISQVEESRRTELVDSLVHDATVLLRYPAGITDLFQTLKMEHEELQSKLQAHTRIKMSS